MMSSKLGSINPIVFDMLLCDLFNIKPFSTIHMSHLRHNEIASKLGYYVKQREIFINYYLMENSYDESLFQVPIWILSNIAYAIINETYVFDSSLPIIGTRDAAIMIIQDQLNNNVIPSFQRDIALIVLDFLSDSIANHFFETLMEGKVYYLNLQNFKSLMFQNGMHN